MKQGLVKSMVSRKKSPLTTIFHIAPTVASSVRYSIEPHTGLAIDKLLTELCAEPSPRSASHRPMSIASSDSSDDVTSIPTFLTLICRMLTLRPIRPARVRPVQSDLLHRRHRRHHLLNVTVRYLIRLKIPLNVFERSLSINCKLNGSSDEIL